MKEKPNFKKKGFIPKNHKENDNPDKLQISQITRANNGESAILEGIIERIVQTPGPTIFYLTDGTGNLALKGFEGPGERAYPNLNEGDAVKVIVRIEEFREELEGEIKKLNQLSGSEKDKILKNILDIQKEKSKPKIVPFLVKSPVLEKLKESFILAATEIRLAISQNRPIIIRHHNDTDGYSAGYALEKAILPLIESQHGFGKSGWEFFSRAPCAAPFYEIDDSIRDTARSLSNEAKFSNKLPLIIIADNGSTPEDILGIKQGKVHGISFIVVDHHYFDEDVISDEVLVHINPWLVGEDGSAFSAGMLCTELARFINTPENINQIPALAGFADRINNPEVMDAYLKIAEKEGYDKELLEELSTVIEFVSAKLRFVEAREYIGVLFGEPRDKQKDLVNLLAPYIHKQEEKGLAIAKSTSTIKQVGKTTVQYLYINDTFPIGFYPKPGRCNGLLHDELQKSKKLTNVVSLGILTDAITMRATDDANFSVHLLIEYLNKHIPEAFVDGGGHKNAGAIRFIPSQQKAVVEGIEKFIKTIQ